MGRPVRVVGTNYDGSPHWTHMAYLVLERGGLTVVQSFAGTRVGTERGEWVSPYHTRGHYWADRWYNVIRVETPGKAAERWVRYYCNIATPAEFDGANLHYVDLQLDVIVETREGKLQAAVIDEEDFDAARVRFRYPHDLIRSARAAVEELLTLVSGRQFPFNK
jgi:protein associated with RNAse G/E